MGRGFVSLVSTIWLLLWQAVEAHSQVLTELEPRAERIVTQKISYLLSERSTSEQQVWQSPNFRQAESDFVQLGFQEAAVWLKIELANPGPETATIYLEFPLSRWSSWTLSQPQLVPGTVSRPDARKLAEHRTPMLVFTLPAGAGASYLLRVESIYGLQWLARQMGIEKAQETVGQSRGFEPRSIDVNPDPEATIGAHLSRGIIGMGDIWLSA